MYVLCYTLIRMRVFYILLLTCPRFLWGNPYPTRKAIQPTITSGVIGEMRKASERKYNINIYEHPYYTFEPDYNYMYVCVGLGCKQSFITALPMKAQEYIENLFSTSIQTEAEEREKMALAIAVFERHIGNIPEINSWGDLAKNATPISGSNRLDCISEAYNTLTYLLVIQDKLKFHDIAGIKHRTTFLIFPHNAVEIISRSARTSFIVDSWYLDNGYPAITIGLKDWSSNSTQKIEAAVQNAMELQQSLDTK